ncbi:large ribosomal subunit protein mL50 [Anolis carolinensis]|uniref:Large ribosomal subunit protein mL50 n=1 Tax=Anolis carolinensis TaxID=28377 RepID=A0A803TXV6_ANOCA|nr:PREDICTED: 39S ribosomal protein L50, mitochondrial [Anolis carolinensis]|eukprot:XP_003216642.1 PREDICTED: 39S ribosomal protein L50, mitochondrial [Anolis carolinensis]
MAASTRLLRVSGHRRLPLGIPARRALWGGQRKKELVAEATEPDVPVEKQPVMVCPPPQSKKYVPPEDLQSRLESLVRGIFGSSVSGDWKKVSLGDSGLKYRLLAQLAADLSHTVPNSQLHQMKSARDVLAFYSTPVKDMSKFDELSTQDLPSNLKINWQY